jgi:hypothetical protein
MAAVWLALFLCLIEIGLLINCGAAILGDLLVCFSGAIQVGGADDWPSSLGEAF